MFDEGGSRVMLQKVLVGAPARKILCVLPWLVLSGALFGQGNSGSAPGGGPANNPKRLALPQDWSDHNVVFSTPANSEKASQLSQDPRYWKQYLGRNLAGTRNANVANPAAGNGGNGGGKKNPPPPGTPQGDWNYSLGPSSGSHVAANMFPAKYNFDINQAPSCTEDFVVFAENVTGLQAVKAFRTGTFTGSNENGTTVTVAGTVLTASGGTAASKGGTFTANVRNSGSVTITNGSNVLTMTPNPTSKTIPGTFSGTPTAAQTISLTVGSNGTTTCGSSTSGTFAISSTLGTEATSLRDAINACPVAAGVTASASGSTTTVTARTNGTAGNSISLGNTLTGFSWAASTL